MKEENFYKYQGTGNDFIILNHLHGKTGYLTGKQIQQLCNRKFGIGADGLIILKPGSVGSAFYMDYYNSDGREGSMCGNGGRCAVACAAANGIFTGSMVVFDAYDGKHFAEIDQQQIVSLKMSDVSEINLIRDFVVLDTGSPHCIKFVENSEMVDVYHDGKEIRNLPEFSVQGINVNFVEPSGASLKVRTYERGVEDETLSCGTGVTASVLAHLYRTGKEGNFNVKVETPGGILHVKGNYARNRFTNLFLCGPAVRVFEGKISF